MDLLVATRTDRKIDTKARPAEAAIGRLVEGVLRRSGYSALRDVSCVAVDQVIYLRGRLPSYYLKQVAQESVASVAGSRRLINLIEVCTPAGRTPIGCNWTRRLSNTSD